MPDLPVSRKRALERERRRRRLRRQREGAGAAASLLLIGLVVGLAYLLWPQGTEKAERVASEQTARVQTRTERTPGSAGRKLNLHALLVRAGKPIADRSRLEQRSTLAAFARRGQPVYCGGSSGRYVALTFDDGPGPYTAKALEILDRANAKATFFLAGRNVTYWPELVRRELQERAVGVHAWTHVSFPTLPRDELTSQISDTAQAIAHAAGERPHMLRPPYGARDAYVDGVARSLGFFEVLWSVDSADSLGASWRKIASNVLDNVRPGSIVLMHENRGQTIRALKYLILPGLKERGYVLVTVPELLVLDPPPPNAPHGYCWE
jgi:peptidoglycan/xylan/chitin deacetylase (PgdA/CDA1 family)